MLVEDNYGRSIRALNSSDALTFMFQIDNSGPPAAVDVRPRLSLPWARAEIKGNRFDLEELHTLLNPRLLFYRLFWRFLSLLCGTSLCHPLPTPIPLPLPFFSHPAQVIEFWRKQRLRYPKAEQVASSLDDYALTVLDNADLYNALPVITEEIGDSWLYGSPADPIKVVGDAVCQTTFKYRSPFTCISKKQGLPLNSFFCSLNSSHNTGRPDVCLARRSLLDASMQRPRR